MFFCYIETNYKIIFKLVYDKKFVKSIQLAVSKPIYHILYISYIIYTVLSNSFLYILIWWNVPVCNELRSKPIHLKLLLPHIRTSNYTVLPFTEDFNFKLEKRVYFSSSSLMVQWSVPAMELSANFLDSDFLSALNPCKQPFFSFCLVEYFHQQLLVLSDSTGIILGYPYWNWYTQNSKT